MTLYYIEGSSDSHNKLIEEYNNICINDLNKLGETKYTPEDSRDIKMEELRGLLVNIK